MIQKTNDFEAFLSFGGCEGVGWYQSSHLLRLRRPGHQPAEDAQGSVHLHRPVQRGPAVTGDAQDEILHKLALDLNENLPEIYLWQPNYLHVYSDKLGGGFAIYPNERESFQKILDWTYSK